jgi:hypothetical protein
MKSEAYYINELKIRCKGFLGRDVQTNTDVKIILDIINKNVKDEISFSTLRRFFGFLKNTKPARKTLNVISQSLGFDNFAHFCTKYNTVNNWSYINSLVRSWGVSSISTNERNKLIEYNNQGATHTGLFLFFLMETGAFEKIDRILKDERVLPDAISEVGEIAELLSISIRKKNKQELTLLSDFLKRNTLFKELCLYLSVDYESFSGAYLYILNQTNRNQNLNKQEQLFAELVNNSYRLFSRRKMKPLKKVSFKMPPVLYGRYIGQFILQHNDSSILFDSLKNDIASEFFLEIFPALIIKKDFQAISRIENQFYEKILTPTNYTYEDKKTIALIAFSINNFHEKNYTAAELNISFINYDEIINSYQNFFKLIGLIPDYHIRKRIEATEADKIKDQYLDLSKSLGFSLFDETFLVDYFSEK